MDCRKTPAPLRVFCRRVAELLSCNPQSLLAREATTTTFRFAEIQRFFNKRVQTRNTNAFTNAYTNAFTICTVVIACLQPELCPCSGVREIFRYLELVVQRLKNGLDVVVLFDELERTIARDPANFGGEIAA